jgi:hypothetical protein
MLVLTRPFSDVAHHCSPASHPRLTLTHLSSPIKQPCSPFRTETDFVQVRIQVKQPAVIMLLAVASIMRWSETGQLLCNNPTMIIEGFLLLALIQAHVMANED